MKYARLPDCARGIVTTIRLKTGRLCLLRLLFSYHRPALHNPQLFNMVLTIWERVLAATAHIGMALMVLRAVRERRLAWLGLAILAHTVMDGTLVVAQYYSHNNIAVVEGALTVLAAGFAVIIWRSYRVDHRRAEAPPAASAPQNA